MTTNEQKRLLELATETESWPVITLLHDAIEPYRLALASARNLLAKAPVKDGYLNWRTARAENEAAISALLGDTE